MRGSVSYRRKLVGTEFVEVPEYRIDGKVVSEKEFKGQFPDKPLSGDGSSFTGWKRPILSDGLACHPEQIPAEREAYRKAGINVDFHEDGRPIIRDRGQRREMLKLNKMHDRQGGFGDG